MSDIELMALGLIDKFGDRADAIVEAQISEATGSAKQTWLAIGESLPEARRRRSARSPDAGDTG